MKFIEFKNKLFELACFNIDQIYTWMPDFDRNNLCRWIKKGLLIRLRQGYFTFPEYKGADFILYFANHIYSPSYISLHTALSFYGIIPQAVAQITSVSSLKTTSFTNPIAEYSYNTIKKDLMFGYDLKVIDGNRTLKMASAEKAILDLLYLYPGYSSAKELKALKFDKDYLHDNLKKDLLKEYSDQFKNKALEKRVQQLFITYGL